MGTESNLNVGPLSWENADGTTEPIDVPPAPAAARKSAAAPACGPLSSLGGIPVPRPHGYVPPVLLIVDPPTDGEIDAAHAEADEDPERWDGLS